MNDVRISVSVEKRHVEDGGTYRFKQVSYFSCCLREIGRRASLFEARQVVHQDRDKNRKEYFTVKGVSYDPYFGALYSDGDPASVRKFVCALQDKNRVGEFMQMIDHGGDVGHLLPFRFELVEVSAT